jgi:hypothetical protein
MPERCPRCGSTHDSLDGVAVHAWKTQDSVHEDVSSKDQGMRVAVTEEYSDTDDPPEADDSDLEDGDGTADSDSDGGLGLSGPPADPDPDPEDGSDSEQVEAPCGCAVDTDRLEAGKTYRCTDHDVKFRYNP